MRSISLDGNLIQGAVSLEQNDDGVKPWRLPHDQVQLFPPDDALPLRAAHCAGVRLRFQTSSSCVKLKIDPVADDLLFDLTSEGGFLRTCPLSASEDCVVFDGLPDDAGVYELWLPQMHQPKLQALLIDDNADFSIPVDTRLRWVTYGSSITHCATAHSPARTWPAYVARKLDLHLTCLGFGGQCHLDPMMAMTIRDLDADVFTFKVGINIQGGSSLSPRTFRPALIGLIQTVRSRHPEKPIIVISPIISPPRETEPNIVGLSLENMRLEVADAVQRLQEAGDEHIQYISGLELFNADHLDYLPDLLHPDGDGYEILAENFIKAMRRTEFPFIF